MKKFLSICMALASAVSMYALKDTIDFSTPAGLEAIEVTPAVVADEDETGKGVEFTTATVGNIVITVDKGTGDNAPVVWTNKDDKRTTELRLYKGNTITLAAKDEAGLLAQVVFAGSDLNITDLKNKKWEGAEHSMTFTTTEQAETCKITKIMTAQAIGVARAIEMITQNDPLSSKPHYVRGIVAGDPFMAGSSIAFFLKDVENPSDEEAQMLQGYKIGKTASSQYTSIEEMTAVFGQGDTILICANALKKYNTIYESDGGYFVKVLGKVPSLEWEKAVVLREEGKWTLTVSDLESDGRIDLIFASNKDNSISGSYNIAEGSKVVSDGVAADITSGTLQFTYKRAVVDDNVYKIQATAFAGDKSYRINKEYRIFAWDGEFPILLAADRPYVPQEGEQLTCAQAREYAFTLDGARGVNITVEGYITDIVTNLTNTFWMDDKAGSGKTIEVYRYLTFDPSDETPQKGQKVRVSGYVEIYGGSTPELTSAAVELLNGTAVENVCTDISAAKFIENGQLYIIRGGVRYNAQGQVVK